MDALDLLASSTTLVGLLRGRATVQPDRLAYTVLLDGEAQEATLTYAQLDLRARAVGATLESQGARGARVLLLYPPGIEYTIAVVGCLYAGAVAVPAYPPDPARLNRTLPRLQALITDAKASFALTTKDILPMASFLGEQARELKELHWLATDDVEDGAAAAWRDPGATRDTLAILQYTSGSTAAPRGVMLTHGNLLHNSAAIHRCFEHTSDSRGVIWLPPYHDMGLIGGVLQPLCGGFPVVLMSPLDFLRRPIRWLQAITRYRATTSGGPSFAYDLCVRKVTPEQLSGLDLSSWDLAFNGAEPVSADTLDRFAATFAPCGFRREAFYPCYGLAEATLITTGGKKRSAPVIRAFQRDGLASNRVVVAEEPAEGGKGDAARRLVGCGSSVLDQRILIVDPESRTPSPPQRIGEIWVSGPSVAQGYWSRPEESEQTFGGTLKDRPGRFLRTGDLGFVWDGELFVTGRIKDLVIIRGRNHYPQDIELTAERSHPALRRGCSAAFSVEVAGEERLVIVAEVDVARPFDAGELMEGIRLAIVEQHEVQAHAVVLLRPGAIPKTSSGKIQRRACRASFTSGELDALGDSVLPEAAVELAPGPASLTRDALLAAAPEERPALLEAYLWQQAARAMKLDPALMDRRRPLQAFGLDSIQSIELSNSVEAALGLPVPLSSLLGETTVDHLAAQLLAGLATSLDARQAPLHPVSRDGSIPLSFVQQRFWFFDRLEPQSPAHHIAVAALLEGPLQVAALRQSFDAVVRRHEILRTTFPVVEGRPSQVIAPASPPGQSRPLSATGLSEEILDLSGLPPAEREAAFRPLARAEAQRPFNLAEGPLLRARLIRLAEDRHLLLLTMHHIISDGWSMGILLRELGELYASALAGRSPELPPLPIQYADFSVWQHRQVETQLLSDLAYWRSRLGGALPALDLPSDRPRLPSRTLRGATKHMTLPAALSDALRALSQREGVTLFMTLLAAWKTLLHRYTGQEDIVVGSPIAGRTRAEAEGLIGCFVNTLVLRTDLTGGPTFLELLRRVREVTLGAYTHQKLPFEKLVEALQPERDLSRTPLFQVLFILQNAPMPALSLADVKLTPLETETGGASFDLTLMITERDEGMQVALEYSLDLFEPASIDRMLPHLRTLLEGIVADPAQRLFDLPLLTAEEQQALCITWNQTAQPIDQDTCLHHLVEALARHRPHAEAVVSGEQRLTYEELDRRSNQLANHLRRRGVGPGAIVGICVERSLDLVVGLLGILKAGAAYVPLDPAYPRERLSFIMTDAQLPVLVTTEPLAKELPDAGITQLRLDADRAEIAAESATPPAVALTGDALAYVIYTSGSTGKPKGVEITHHAVVNLLTSMRERPGLGDNDRLLAVTSLSFDIAALEIFLPLSVGARLDVASRELLVDGAAVAEHLSRADITVMQATPATFRLLLEAGWEGKPDLKILIGGEAVPRELADALVDRAASVWNMYGPTETTVWSCVHPITKGPGQVPIGRPIANTRVHVLSDRLSLLPVGIPGELYIGGAGLARGYHRRPDLTAERFVSDPFAAPPAGRLYRTGDLVKWLPDGSLEFLGRLDHQVKIRGFRIELGEIEAALDVHPAVEQAVVVARAYAGGDHRLVAYLTAQGSAAPTPGELRAHLQETLPEYMIPSAFVVLPAMPLTPNGKVDRRALPAPEEGAAEVLGGSAAPRTPVEQMLAGLWARILGGKQIGAQASFFELGGHSLLATRLIAEIRRLFGVDVPLRAVFESPTLAGMAARIEAARRTHAAAAPPLTRASRDAELPLSFAQARLWFLHQLDPQSPLYNVPAAVRVRGQLDVDVLEQSLRAIVARHEVLRTCYAMRRGKPRQEIVAAPGSPLSIVDLRAKEEAEREAEARRLAEREARRPFDLSLEPPLRATLLRLGEQEHMVLLTMHHIASDGWSLGVLVSELGALYGALSHGQRSPLRALPIQYVDFALWQQRWLTGSVEEAQLSYWTRQLDGAPPLLNLPTDRPRPAVQSFRGATLRLSLSAELTSALRALCEREGVTLFMALLAAFQTLLHRYTGQDDIVVGSPIAGRTHAEVQDLIGCFVNTLVLRADLSGAPSFVDLLKQVRRLTLDAYENQDLPFERLVEALGLERSLNRTPLFQVAFVLQNDPMSTPALPGLSLELQPVEVGTAKFDLTLSLGERAGRLEGYIEYSTDLFDEATIGRMAGHLETLLHAVGQAPERSIADLPILTETERRQLLGDWNRTTKFPVTGCLHALFEAQAARTPWATAVTCGDDALSYAGLNARANMLANHLRALGVGPAVPVGLFMERSLDLIVAILGILKAGGAYLPLDPSYPPERLAFMLEDARVPVLLTQAGLRGRLPPHGSLTLCVDVIEALLEAQSDENPGVALSPDSLAYIIYTSGSTGKPKGVLVPHAHVVRLFEATQAWFQFDARDVWTLFHSYAFDFSVWEIWGALLHGGRLVVVPYEVSRSPADFHELLCRERVSVLNQTPSAFRQIIHADATAPLASRFALRLVIFGGEALDVQSLRPWFDRHGDESPRLINMYGITETTVHVTYHPVRRVDLTAPWSSVIGRPIPDLQIYVLDPGGQPVPVGVPGEMVVGGAGVSQGYLDRPELTAQRFVPDPFGEAPGARLYRSGDLARFRPSGDLEYLGRIDHQVKIRGFRIELGEIEAALGQHSAVREAFVMVRDDVPGDKQLVAYVVSKDGGPLAIPALRAHLQQKLPSHAVPSAFVELDSLPLTRNGKVNRQALPAPGHERPETEHTYAAPRTKAEEQLAEVWAEVLQLDQVGIDDNFFELGGDSIRNIQVLSRSRERGLALSLQQLFKHQTIRELSEVLTKDARPAASTGDARPFELVSAADRARMPDGIEDAYPITALQAGMIYHSEYSTGSAVYHDVFSFHLEAELDVPLLRRAIDELCARHAALRTSFDLGTFSEPLQLVHRTVAPLCEVSDLRGGRADEQRDLLAAWLEKEKHRGFAWTSAPLLRFYVHQRSERSFQFTVSFHHAILDGWSVASMLTELFQQIAGERRGEAQPGRGATDIYRRFVALEREAVASEETRRFWAEQIDGSTLARVPRLKGAAGDRGALPAEPRVTRVRILPETSRGLRDLARSAGAPLKSALLAAHVRVIGLLSGQMDVVTGMVTHGRPEVPGAERALGLFLNTLPFRQRIRAGSWLDLVRDTFDIEQRMLPHQRYPLAQLQRLHGGALFETTFNFNHFHVYKGLDAASGVRFVEGSFFEQTNLALAATFSLDLASSDVELRVVVNEPGVSDLQIQKIARYYEVALATMAREPSARADARSLLSDEELRLVLGAWNHSVAEIPAEQRVHRLFEAQVERTPGATAVVSGEESQSYADLNARANQLARRLLSLGVRPESRVGLYLERSIDLMVGVLGILKAGGAYVPLDPAYPRERLAFMLEDAGVEVLVTSERLQSRLPDRPGRAVLMDVERDSLARELATNPLVDVRPDNLAYVIYTSGSAGRPKGVMVQHRSVVNLSVALQEGVYGPAIPAEARDRSALRVGMNAPLSFDASVKQWIQILHGSSLHIIPEETRLDAEELLRFIRSHALQVIDCVPSQLKQLLASGFGQQPDASPALVLVGGEAVDPRTWARIRGAPEIAFFNVYGPTECTVDATACRISGANEPTIGRSLANMQVYLLDENLDPVPIGVPGEIHIGGAGLARGYLGRPSLTAERFIPDPFGEPGARLYKTGDLGRYLPDGNIEYLGRVDHQVKLRGFRIELPEIEAALKQHPAVRDAVVVVQGDTPGEERLVAYVVAHGPPPPAPELRRFVEEQLPAYMVPAVFVGLERLPLTPNGKVDRRALPAPSGLRLDQGSFVPPRTPVEEMLAAVWGHVLRLDRVGVLDDFFLLGGHSLLATQVLARVRSAFSIDLPLRALFEAPTLAGLAERVEIARRAGARPPAPPPQRVERGGAAPLSFAQQRLWFLAQMEPDSPFYNVPGGVWIHGRLDRAALERSLQEVVRRHEVLRTTFAVVDGRPHQVIADDLALALTNVDLRALPASDQQIEVRRQAAGEAQRPFDLAQGPLLRATLFQLGDTEHVLFLTMHHIVSDGWSVGVLMSEVSAIYEAFSSQRSSPLPELPIQYADFACWQRQWLTDELLEPQIAYWKRMLGGEPGAGGRGAAAILELPTDRPRPPVQTFRGASQPVRLSPALSSGVRALCQQEGVTLFMALLAAFQTLLHRYSGQDDIVVGAPVAGRTQVEAEGLIGFFVNTLVLRADLSGEPSFLDLLRQVRQVTLGAYAHQDVPFERLVDALKPERDLSRTPLFQVTFVLQNAPASTRSISGLSLAPFELESATAKFDLSLSLTDTEEGLQGTLEYNTDLFDAATCARMVDHLQVLLEGAVREPGRPIARLPILTEPERRTMLVEWNDTAAARPHDGSIHELFESWVKRTPEATALMFEAQRLTYRELNRRANQLANHLIRLGVRSEELVAISVERSPEMVIGILGILKAGGAYVPLDPSYPRDRLMAMLADTRAKILLTQRDLLPLFAGQPARALCLDADGDAIGREAEADPAVGVKPRNLAYVIYTSGSTGRPKGVLVEHRGLCNLEEQSARFGVRAGCRVLQFARFGFDASVWEIFMALTSGATLCLAPSAALLPGPDLTRFLREQEINVAFILPSALSVLPAEPFPSLTALLVGGEACPPGLPAQWGSNRRLINAYGPTEASVVATAFDCAPVSGRVPIGRPLANVRVYVLDANLAPVPVGVAGELHIGGLGVARGYLNHPELSAERFIPSPFGEDAGARLYRTGDRVRWLPDGTLEYLRRIDHQVKVRGFRIELGEIESVLAQHPAVREAIVLAREDMPGDRRLVAYWAPREAPGLGAGELRAYLKEKLPDYMVPSAFVALEAMPLTPAGKVDRRALPPPDASRFESEDTYVPPRTPTEGVLAGIWAETLGVQRVGAHDSFFDLGGHSLLATQALARLNASFGIALPLRALFEESTVAALAGRVEAARRRSARSVAPPLRPVPRSGDAPLSFGQQRLWFLNQLEPDSAFYNIPAAVRIRGALDIEALERSLREIVARHEVLRTTIVTEHGQPRQVIAPASALALPVVELGELGEGEREQRIERHASEDAQRPFDLAKGPLVRAELLRLGSEEHVLLLTMHHIVSDGWSVGVLLKELTALYPAFRRGKPSPLPDLPLQYGDYAVWQRQWLDGEAREEQLTYWKRQLAGAAPSLDLPTDRPRPPMQRFRGATQAFELSGELTAALTALSRRAGATPFMTLVAAFQVLLGRYAGVEEVSVGTPVAGRNRTELEGFIGLFVNTLVLRTDLSGDPSFEELLGRVREMALGAYEHQDVPFDQVVDALQPPRDLGRSPLFQVAFALQNAPVPALVLEELTLSLVLAESTTAKFDLSLTLASAGEGMQGWLQYNTDLFDGATMERMAGHYRALLESAAREPKQRLSRLRMLPEAEREQLLRGWNPVAAPPPSPLQAGLEHYVLDEHLEPVPVGVVGELYLDAGLSPEGAEAADFCPHPFSDHPGALLYRTGERARLLADGRLERESRRGATPAETAAGAVAVEPQEYVAPRTPIEETLAQLWREALSVERVSVHDNFFSLGGNSLLSMMVLHRIQESLEVEVPLHQFFEAPTVVAVAAFVEAEQAAARGEGDEATRRGSARSAAPALRPVPRSGDAPLSFGQQRLWFLNQLEPDSAFYNIPVAVRIRGALDTEALERSLREIVARHEVLRTTIVTEHGQPRQVIAPEPALALPVVELGELGDGERERRVEQRTDEEAQRPFDLAKGPLVRAELLRLGSEEHVLLLTMHHIVSDGWSVSVLLKELTALYPAFRRGKPSPLPDLPLQYGDYAVWQRQWLDGEAREEQLTYWKRQLAGAAPSLDLPTDRPRPPMQRFRGATQAFELSGELTAALTALSRRAGATPFMTLVAAFQVLLGRYAGVEEVSVGTPVAGRNRTELEGFIGLFVNTLVLRTDLSGDPSFEELLARVREMALGAYEHQDVPFDQVVDALQPPRDLGRSPLFQVAFALQNAPVPALALEELTLSPALAESTTAKFDLSLTLASAGEGMQGWLQYNTDLFDGATMERMAGHYRALLESAAREPKQRLSRLRILPEAEREQLLRGWNPAAAPPPSPLQAGLEHYVLDEHLEPVPVGVVGELYLDAGLSPEGAEAADFCPHPFSDHPGALLYRTGERARLLADGRLERESRRGATPAETAAGAGAVEPQEYVAPRTPIEETLAQFWREALSIERVSVLDNFFSLGGNSLLSMMVLHRIQESLEVEVPLHQFFEAPTVVAVAAFVEAEQAAARGEGTASTPQSRARSGEAPVPALLCMRAGDAHRRPLFFVHGAGGSVLNYADLVRHLDPARPFYGIHSPELDGEGALPASVEAMARDYLAELRGVQPHGPYLLGGWSFGGVVAFEMAQQLRAAGETVATLALIDSFAPTARRAPALDELAVLAAFGSMLGLQWQHLALDLDHLRALGPRDRLAYVLGQARNAGALTVDIDQAERWFRVFERDLKAVRGYTPSSPYPGSAVLFRAEMPSGDDTLPKDRGWSAWIPSGLAAHALPGDHHSMLRAPHVAVLADVLTRHLNDVEAGAV